VKTSPENIARILATAALGSIGLYIDSGDTTENFGFLGNGIASVLFFGIAGLLLAGLVRWITRKSANLIKRSLFNTTWRYSVILSALFAIVITVERYF